MEKKLKELQEAEQEKSLLVSKVDTLANAVERLQVEFESGCKRLNEIDDHLVSLQEREEKLKETQKKNDENLAEKERK